MTLKRFECLLQTFPSVRMIAMHGEGESLLHPDFFDMAVMAKSIQPTVNLSVVTNGSLLSAGYAEQLVEVGFQHVAVSIESVDPRVFWEIRGGNVENVIEGIRSLLAARNIRRAVHPTVSLAVTVLQRTLNGFPAIISLYEELGLDGGLTIQRLQAMPAYTRYYNEAMQSQCLLPHEIGNFMQWIRHDPKMQRILSHTEKANRESFRNCGYINPGQCHWLTKGLYVAADGTALACCFQKDAARNGFGIIGQTPIEEIHTRRRQWAEDFERRVFPEGCRGCPKTR
jgi:MoaA/NifB/PqqE/SkfB family radical SAM enzyme